MKNVENIKGYLEGRIASLKGLSESHAIVERCAFQEILTYIEKDD